jgi:hypothetical protein
MHYRLGVSLLNFAGDSRQVIIDKKIIEVVYLASQLDSINVINLKCKIVW